MTKKQNSQHPFIHEILEKYTTLPEGIPVWKTIGIEITKENFAENLFFLSTDLADAFEMRHDHFCSRNSAKLLKKGYLNNHMYCAVHMARVGSNANRVQNVNYFTINGTKLLLMNLPDAKSRQWINDKKLAVFNRLLSFGDESLQHDANEDVTDCG